MKDINLSSDSANKASSDDIDKLLFYYSSEKDKSIILDPNSDISKVQDHKQTPPFKKVSYINALKKFVRVSKSRSLENSNTKSKLPKKEYLRTMLLRGHKRAIRQSMDKKIPIRTINKVDKKDSKQVEAWTVLSQYNVQHKSEVFENSKLENSPLTDNYKRLDKLQSVKKENFKTHNNDYSKNYFTNEFIRNSFLLYLDLIFSRIDCSLLCKRFKFYCCLLNEHLASCSEKWSLLYDQLKTEFVHVQLAL